MVAAQGIFRLAPAAPGCSARVLPFLLLLAVQGAAAAQAPSGAKELPATQPSALPAGTVSEPQRHPLPGRESLENLVAREMVGLGKGELVAGFSAGLRDHVISEELEAYIAGLPPETEETAGSEEPLSPSSDPVQWGLSEASAEAGSAYLHEEPERGWKAESALPVKILARWAVSEIEELLLSSNVPTFRVELGAELDPRSDLLIIPPGGLAAVWKSPTAGRWLRVFVAEGGALLVLAQPQGRYFSALPRGDEIEALGWSESLVGRSDLLRQEGEHPALSAVSQTMASDVALAGHFVRIPQGAEVLLKVTGSDFPVLATYPVGAGRVLITSVIGDHPEGLSPTSALESSILRDAVAWLRKPLDLPAFRPTSSGAVEISRSLRVRNLTQWAATQVTFHWIRPDGSVAHQETRPIALMPGGESVETARWSMVQPAATGIWFIDYSLRDARWPVQIRGLDVGSRFVIPEPHAATARFSPIDDREPIAPELARPEKPLQ